MRSIIVVSAGLSSPSSSSILGQLVGNSIKQELSSYGEDASVYSVELKDLAHDLADAMVNAGQLSPALKQTIDSVASADVVVAVTPVFQASFSGLFKMFFDCFSPQALVNVPVVIAAHAGTKRHSLVLEYAVRPLFSYLRAAIVPTGIYVTSDENLHAPSDKLVRRIERSAAEAASLMIPPHSVKF